MILQVAAHGKVLDLLDSVLLKLTLGADARQHEDLHKQAWSQYDYAIICIGLLILRTLRFGMLLLVLLTTSTKLHNTTDPRLEESQHLYIP